MSKPDLNKLREEMVAAQIIARGISNKKVIDAFRKVPRHEFVSKEYLDNAYDDYPLPIGKNQTISQPYMVALETECLGLKGGEKVLEIGTGSGYQTAILAEIAKQVYSVERVPELVETAKHNLLGLGYDNFEIKVDDGTLGWKEHAPYDAIVVTAGAPCIPQSLLNQLKDGGRLVIPVGEELGQILTVVTRVKDSFETAKICGCMFVPLIGKEGWDR